MHSDNKTHSDAQPNTSNLLAEQNPDSTWLVYMILTSDNQVYTGITTNMDRRWHQHLSGKAGARYFRARKPVKLCYLEEGHNRSSASKREYAIKTLSAAAKRRLMSDSQATFSELLMKYRLQALAQTSPSDL